MKGKIRLKLFVILKFKSSERGFSTGGATVFSKPVVCNEINEKIQVYSNSIYLLIHVCVKRTLRNNNNTKRVQIISHRLVLITYMFWW